MNSTHVLSSTLRAGKGITGIGSLPHTDPVEAVRFIAEVCPELPFWPQLPQRAVREQMVEQALAPLADLLQPRGSTYGYMLKQRDRTELLRRLNHGPAVLTPEYAAGFFAFEQALATQSFPHAVALKGQIIGPVTLAAQLFVEQRSLLYDPEALAAMSMYIQRLTHWQIERLAHWRTPVLFFLDEPCLALLPHAGSIEAPLKALRAVSQAMRSTGTLVGIHCCATIPGKAPPLALLCQTDADIISYDAYQTAEALCNDPLAQGFVRDGGIVSFGLIPTLRDLTDVTPAGLLARWIVASGGWTAESEIARHTVITATCGLGLLNEHVAHRSFQLAREVAQLIAQMTERR